MNITPTITLIAAASIFTGCCNQYYGYGSKNAPKHRHGRVTPLCDETTPAHHAVVARPVINLPERSPAVSAVTTVPAVVERSDTYPPTPPVPGGGGESLELKTEDFAVSKGTTSNGVARIRKYVVSEQKSIPVTLCREEFTIERIPATGVSSAPWGSGEAVIDIPLTRETAAPVVTPRVYEIVRFRKTKECDTQTISATVRTEKVDITR